jgi:hypothetical protein
VLERLLGALSHVHARGILHLDVKPANVLLGCEDGPDELEPDGLAGLRLSDFGLAGSTVASKVAGTVGYAAPEQLAGRWRELSPATDLFALGELAWQLATGRLRHDGGAVAVHRAQLRHERAAFEPRLPVPRGLREWLEWLLHPAATARPQRAIEALEALPDDLLPGRLPAPALSESSTWLESEALDEVPAAAMGVARAEPPGRPWRVREVWGRVRWLEGGGLGPVHTRMPRFVVTGAPVCGASRLAAWLGGRAHEADQAVVLQYGPGDDLASVLRRAARAEGLDGPPLHQRLRLAGAEWGFPRDVCQALSEVVADGADPLPLIRRLPRARPLLILHDDPTWLDAWNPVLAALLAEDRAPVFVVIVSARADTPGGVLTVGALGMSDVDPLDRWMGLARPLADGVLVASGGVPGRLVALLGDLDRAGALRSTADGFVADGPLPEAAPFAPPDADHPTPPPSVRAWNAVRSGRLGEARAAIDELVWRRHPVDLAAVALSLAHRDPEPPRRCCSRCGWPGDGACCGAWSRRRWRWRASRGRAAGRSWRPAPTSCARGPSPARTPKVRCGPQWRRRRGTTRRATWRGPRAAAAARRRSRSIAGTGSGCSPRTSSTQRSARRPCSSSASPIPSGGPTPSARPRSTTRGSLPSATARSPRPPASAVTTTRHCGGAPARPTRSGSAPTGCGRRSSG